MASNSRLAIAVHTAGILAIGAREPVRSQLIAGSVKTNPVVVRRIIGSLVKHGLVEVRMGSGGGSRLTRPPEEITLADIYLALEEDEVFHVPPLAETHRCPVGRAVRPVLRAVLDEAEEALIDQLRTISLAGVMDLVRERLAGGLCVAEADEQGPG